MKKLPRLVILAALSGFLVVAARAAVAGTASPAPATAPTVEPNCKQMSIGSRPNPSGKGFVSTMVPCTAETMKNDPQCAALCAENAARDANPPPPHPASSYLHR